MGWTEIARCEHGRSGLRYATDYTEEEWAVVRPLFRRTSGVGRPRKHKARTLCIAIQYIARRGAMAQLPKDFSPFTTVQYQLYRTRDNGLFDVINAVFVGWGRVSEGRTPAPTAGIIDSQSVKTTEASGPHRYDAGKKIKGRKRHVMTDTLGNMLEGVTRLFADSGYAAQKLEPAVTHIDRLTVKIIRRADLTGFIILPRRGVVERTLPWLNGCRRLAKDWQASIASPECGCLYRPSGE